MEEDELFYLEPGFEPASLTVPRLRNILLTHDIDYPSNAKKPQLLQLFSDELVPQARKLLSASKRVKRSARGIVDVPSSQASTIDEEEVADPEPPPPPSTRRGGRRKTKTAEDDSDVTLLAPETTRSRRTTNRGTRSIEPEPVEPEPAPVAAPKPRGRGRPTKTPKQESPDPEAWTSPADDSPFTADNPFQSASSPPPEARVTDKRRKTIESNAGTDKRKSTSTRRRIDGTVAKIKDEETKKISTFEMPVTTLNRRQSPSEEQELVPAGEEFAPEEALELAQQEASGQVVRPARRRQAASSWVLQAILWPLVVITSFFTTVWVQEKYSVGYCNIGNDPALTLGGVEIPEWANAIRPGCEECPQHAFCYQNLETKCDEDFVLKHHPLTLGGFLPIPLPPTCEPDSEKARRVQNVVERAVDVLRERNAKFECSEPLEGETTPLKSPAMSESELKATLAAKRTKRMTQEEFDALFNEAVPEIMSRDEVVSVESTGGTRHIRSTSRAKQSLGCAIRTSLRLWAAELGLSLRRKLVEYFWPLAVIFLAAGSSLYVKRRIEWRRTEDEWAKDLARQAFDRLSTHATLHAEDPDTYLEPFLLVSHLRDQILAEDISKKWVQDLWGKVMAKVKKNSNVRELNQEMRKGDYGLTWEWIGPLAALPEGSSGRRRSGITGSRKSTGRYSMLPPASSPLSGLSTVPADEEGRQPEMSERKWEESRPIY